MGKKMSVCKLWTRCVCERGQGLKALRRRSWLPCPCTAAASGRQQLYSSAALHSRAQQQLHCVNPLRNPSLTPLLTHPARRCPAALRRGAPLPSGSRR